MTYLIQTNENELKKLKYAIFSANIDEATKKELLSFLARLKARKTTDKVLRATNKATKKRTDSAKKKIENAINIMRLENKKMTYYAIAKRANVSYNTAKKYAKEIVMSSSKSTANES
jgi:predicted transcriptional regulator